MAKPTTKSWSQMIIWLGDGASPEDFTTAVCGLNAKSFGISASTSDSEVPDCDDPDAAVWVERVIRALSSQISGSGVMALETFDLWRAWMLSITPKNVRVTVGASPQGYFEGSFVLTNFELTANLGDGKIQVSVTLQNDGPIAWVVGAP